MPRKLGRGVAIAVLVIAGLATPLCVAVAIDNDGDSDLIVGGIVLAVLAAGVATGAWYVQRALRPDRTRADDPATGLPQPSQLPAVHMPAGIALPGLAAESGGTGRAQLVAGAVLVVAAITAVIVLAT